MVTVDQYIETVFKTRDNLLSEVVETIADNNMPSISVSANARKLLTLLVSISGAKEILEIGALGGYSGICLARGFGNDGHLTSLELEEEYAKLAHENLTKAGFGEQVTYRVGKAFHDLKKLVTEQKQFDFFFIDADKGNYENYLDYALKLAKPNALIVADNVLAGGTVVNQDATPGRYTDVMRKFNEKVANHPQLESLLIPLGDGLTVSRVIK
jgi:caffeoyl-CoA O-methyltransferase